MDEKDHEELKSLIAPYALGALPADEIPAVRSHLLECPECRTQADSYARVSDELALSVEPVALPSGFAERVTATATEESGVARPSPERARRGWRLGQILAYAALLVVFAGLTVAVVDTRQELDANREVLAALVHEEGGIRLTGEAGATARVVPRRDGAVFVATGLPEAPDAHIYQLWLMRGDEPVSAGIFDASDAIVVLEVSQSLQRYRAAAVTLEPGGGSTLPTTTPVIASSPELRG